MFVCCISAVDIYWFYIVVVIRRFFYIILLLYFVKGTSGMLPGIVEVLEIFSFSILNCNSIVCYVHFVGLHDLLQFKKYDTRRWQLISRRISLYFQNIHFIFTSFKNPSEKREQYLSVLHVLLC